MQNLVVLKTVSFKTACLHPKSSTGCFAGKPIARTLPTIHPDSFSFLLASARTDSISAQRMPHSSGKAASECKCCFSSRCYPKAESKPLQVSPPTGPSRSLIVLTGAHASLTPASTARLREYHQIHIHLHEKLRDLLSD